MKKILITLLILLFSSVVWGGDAHYVDPTAAGGGNGSYDSPWNSMAQVMAHAYNTGDDIYFKVGTTLTMTTHLNITWHGTESDPVVIGAYYGKGLFGLNGGNRPILLGSKTTPVPAAITNALVRHYGPGYIHVIDLHIKDSYGQGISLSEAYYPDFRRGMGNIVRNCYIQDVGRQGIIIARASYCLVENNHLNGTSQVPILEASGKIAYNGAAIEITGMGNETLTQYTVVRGNTVHRSGESIGIYSRARYTTVEDNTVYDFHRVGIYAAGSRDGTIRNNIVYQPDPADSTSSPKATDRVSLIHLDVEGHVPEMVGDASAGNWVIHDNLLGGGRIGLWLQCNANAYGIYQVNNTFYNNRIVECDRNFWVHQTVTGWSGNEFNDNYSFIFTSGLVHHYGDANPIGVTFNGNHYSTSINTPASPFNVNAVYDDPDLVKTTGWRSLPVDGSVDETWWAFTSEPADPEPGESALDATNTYGGGTYTPTRAFIMDDGTGTTLTDHSANGADATLTNPAWSANGLDMTATGQVIACPVANWGATFTVFMAYTSSTRTGSDYGKFFYYYNSTVRDWQLERYTSDTEIRSDIGNVTQAWPGVLDVFDQLFHSLMVTYNDTSNTRCLYVDGALQSCETATFANPTWTGNFYLGGKPDGTRIINATLHAFYIWPNVLVAADAASLHADYDQLFTDPPDRTLVPWSAPSRLGVVDATKPRNVVNSTYPISVVRGQ